VADLAVGETRVRPGLGFGGAAMDGGNSPIHGMNGVAIVAGSEWRSVAETIVNLVTVNTYVRLR